MSNFMTREASVEANTLYDGKKRRCSNCTATLPSVEHTTVETDGMLGTVEMPLRASLEDMEFTVSFNGEKKHLAALCAPGKHDLLLKWVEQHVNSEGKVKIVPYQAAISGYPLTSMPEKETGRGTDTEELEITYKVVAYKLVERNRTLLDINRQSGILKVWNGKKLKDYSLDYESYL